MQEDDQEFPVSGQDQARGCSHQHLRTYIELNEEIPKLETKCTQEFHNMVAKGLFLTKSERPDIMTAIAYVCALVSRIQHKDDCSKLVCMLYYFHGTKQLFMTC